jgi:hypothetical protein
MGGDQYSALNAQGNGTLIVAVGENGKIETSPDGINWTARTTGFVGNAVFGIAYNGQNWIAVASNGLIETSPDGITWTARSSGFGSNNIDGIACLNGSNTGLLSTGSPYNGSGAQLYGGGSSGIGAEVTAGTYGIGLKATGGINNAAIQAIAGTGGVALQTAGNHQNLASGQYDIGSIAQPFHKMYLANEVTCSGITPMMGPLSVNGNLSVTGTLAVSTSKSGGSTAAPGLAQEAWIVVGSGGSAPNFVTGWSNVGAGFEVCQFFKDSCGIVHLTGLVKYASGGSVVFTLPEG